jgi:hypothetical protein
MIGEEEKEGGCNRMKKQGIPAGGGRGRTIEEEEEEDLNVYGEVEVNEVGKSRLAGDRKWKIPDGSLRRRGGIEFLS